MGLKIDHLPLMSAIDLSTDSQGLPSLYLWEKLFRPEEVNFLSCWLECKEWKIADLCQFDASSYWGRVTITTCGRQEWITLNMIRMWRFVRRPVGDARFLDAGDVVPSKREIIVRHIARLFPANVKYGLQLNGFCWAKIQNETTQGKEED